MEEVGKKNSDSLPGVTEGLSLIWPFELVMLEPQQMPFPSPSPYLRLDLGPWLGGIQFEGLDIECELPKALTEAPVPAMNWKLR